MGSSQSAQIDGEEDEDEEDEEEQEEERDDNGNILIPNGRHLEGNTHMVKKILEQEPEMLPCYASASPLSPQLSSLGTPRLGSSIKVWDPYNVLAPPPPPPPPPRFSRTFSSSSDAAAFDDDQTVIEVFMINHGETEMSLRPELVAGRCPETALTPNGKRQARALSVFLNSQGVRFSAVYSSPLDRARATAASVCQDMNFPEEQIKSSDLLLDISLGDWEGCLSSEIYTPEIVNLIDRFQPDFCAPSGESLRQVEFRMVQFLNGTVLELPEKLKSDSFSHHNESQGFSHNSHALGNSIHDRDGPAAQPNPWDLLHRPRPGLSRKKFGKSRLQVVTTTGDQETEDEFSPQDSSNRSSLHEVNMRSSSSHVSSIAIFTHSVPIKCLITGLLGCSPVMSHKLCIEDSSVTVLRHTWKGGWQVQRLNDNAHLRLL